MPVGEYDYAKKLIPIFNNLYDRTLQLLVDYDPCHVSGGACERHRRREGENFCCVNCKYLGIGGCTVKALQCKLWVCSYDYVPEAIRADFKRDMWAIFIEADRLNLLVTRGSMEDSIANACKIYMYDKKDLTVPRMPKIKLSKFLAREKPLSWGYSPPLKTVAKKFKIDDYIAPVIEKETIAEEPKSELQLDLFSDKG